MSTLLENITGMIEIFQQYSNNDKETETLSKKELKELLEVELRAVLKVTNRQNNQKEKTFCDLKTMQPKTV